MHRIRTDIDRLSPDFTNEFAGIPTSILSDVTGNTGITMESEITPVSPDVSLAGSALTVNAAPGDNLIIHKAITLAEPGDVLVVDGDGFTETAFIGDLMAETCKVQGIRGVVIDGAVRDKSDIQKLDYPVYARGINPEGPDKARAGSINVPISCGGMTVNPGDLVVGDGDGIAVLPPGNLDEVLSDANEKIAGEAATREAIKDGKMSYYESGYDELFAELVICVE